MKAGRFNGQTKSNAGKTRQMPSGERRAPQPWRTVIGRDTCSISPMRWGRPLNVVLGRMEYLLGRAADRETAHSLKAIMSPAEQLVALCQQLLDEARAVHPVADPGTPV